MTPHLHRLGVLNNRLSIGSQTVSLPGSESKPQYINDCTLNAPPPYPHTLISRRKQTPAAVNELETGARNEELGPGSGGGRAPTGHRLYPRSHQLYRPPDRTRG